MIYVMPWPDAWAGPETEENIFFNLWTRCADCKFHFYTYLYSYYCSEPRGTASPWLMDLIAFLKSGTHFKVLQDLTTTQKLNFRAQRDRQTNKTN